MPKVGEGEVIMSVATTESMKAVNDTIIEQNRLFKERFDSLINGEGLAIHRSMMRIDCYGCSKPLHIRQPDPERENYLVGDCRTKWCKNRQRIEVHFGF